MGKKPVGPFTIAQVEAFYKNSKTPTSMDEVTVHLNIYKHCVYNAVKRYDESDEFTDKNDLDVLRRLTKVNKDI